VAPGIATCGRFASFLPAEAIARIFGTVNPLSNVAPTQNAAVVRRHPETGARCFAGLFRLLKCCVTSFEQKLTKVVS
jgi:hypothetical protein